MRTETLRNGLIRRTFPFFTELAMSAQPVSLLQARE